MQTGTGLLGRRVIIAERDHVGSGQQREDRQAQSNEEVVVLSCAKAVLQSVLEVVEVGGKSFWSL